MSPAAARGRPGAGQHLRAHGVAIVVPRPTWGFDVSSKQLFIGWIAGAGAELAINGNWSIKAKELVGSFDTRTLWGT